MRTVRITGWDSHQHSHKQVFLLRRSCGPVLVNLPPQRRRGVRFMPVPAFICRWKLSQAGIPNALNGVRCKHTAEQDYIIDNINSRMRLMMTSEE